MNFAKRLEKARLHLASLPCDALLIEHPTDLLYMTGLELSSGKLLLTMEEACLVIDGRYIEAAAKQTLYPVVLYKEGILQEQIITFQIRSLGFDEQHTTYANFLNLQNLTEVIASGSVMQQLRLIKDEEEIDCLRKAAKLGCEGFQYAASLLKEGLSEKEIAFELEFFWKKRGAQKLAFDSIIAFGPNSSMPHYRAGSSLLKKNTSVLIDIGVVLDHYHSDMTRVVFFGSPPPIMQEIYSIVEEAKARALAICRPGNLIGELDRVARDYISSQGYRDKFTHSLGHGLGLDIHEPPIIRDSGPYRTLPLQPGMAITIEPGIYLPGIGGVRLEDTIVITENGYENLTQSSP